MKDQGICRYCLKTFSGSGMSRHLVACKARMEEIKQEKNSGKSKKSIYHLKIWGWKPNWLHIEMNSTTTLRKLDGFLRRIWLECCGHLSQFTINGVNYLVQVEDDYYGWGSRPRSMNYQLKKVLGPKDTFEYEYDFGTTTYLKGQVIDERKGRLKEKISIIARNNPPDYPCIVCDGKATDACSECYETYCETCLEDLEEHECGEEMSLPIVNSPRMGECGYTGYYERDTFMTERFNH